MLLKKPNERTFLFCFIAVIVLIELLVSFQGFDLCDEGWALSGYQQFFRHPNTIQYQFLYYNSLVVGGLWQLFFGQYGILAYRFLDSVFILLTSLTVYYTLRGLVNRWHILIGIAAAILMRDWGSMIFNHNSISALICILAVWCLARALNRNSLLYLFVSFVLLGINIFSRLPNLAMLTLGLLIFIDFFYKRDRSLLLRQLMVCIIGFAAGLSFVLAMMKLTGALHIFSGALADLRSAGSDKDSTHQIPYMMNVYLQHYAEVFKILGSIVLLVISFILIQTRIKALSFRLLLSVIVFSGFIYLLFKWQSTVVWSYSFTTLVLTASLYIYRRNIQIVQICAMALITANFLPLGSDFGIGNMGYASLWISWPLSIGLLAKYLKNLPPKLKTASRLLSISMLAVFLVRAVVIIGQTCYFDPGSRLDKRYKIKNDLATTYTTKEKAEIMNNLLFQLSKYVKKDDYLLCFQSIPMINYLTETKPYLYNSWVWTYDPSLMDRKFKAARANIDGLPVIVREKCQPLSGQWTKPVSYYDREDLPSDYEYKGTKIKLINDFQRENRYVVAWENSLFQILVPPSFSRP